MSLLGIMAGGCAVQSQCHSLGMTTPFSAQPPTQQVTPLVACRCAYAALMLPPGMSCNSYIPTLHPLHMPLAALSSCTTSCIPLIPAILILLELHGRSLGHNTCPSQQLCGELNRPESCHFCLLQLQPLARLSSNPSPPSPTALRSAGLRCHARVQHASKWLLLRSSRQKGQVHIWYI